MDCLSSAQTPLTDVKNKPMVMGIRQEWVEMEERLDSDAVKGVTLQTNKKFKKEKILSYTIK